MGGYVIEYPGDFAYLTIRGAGHMVPEYMYKPAGVSFQLCFATFFSQSPPSPGTSSFSWSLFQSLFPPPSPVLVCLISGEMCSVACVLRGVSGGPPVPRVRWTGR